MNQYNDVSSTSDPPADPKVRGVRELTGSAVVVGHLTSGSGSGAAPEVIVSKPKVYPPKAKEKDMTSQNSDDTSWMPEDESSSELDTNSQDESPSKRKVKLEPNTSTTTCPDLIKRSLAQRCEIPTCGGRSDRLTFATASILAYFGYTNRTAVVKVCPICCSRAERFSKRAINAVKAGKISELANEPQKLKPLNNSIENESEAKARAGKRLLEMQGKEEVEVPFERWEVEGLVNNIMSKFKIASQADHHVKDTFDMSLKLEVEQKKDIRMVEMIMDKMDVLRERFNGAVFGDRKQPMVIQELEINADGSTRRKNLAVDPSVFVDTSSVTKLVSGIKKGSAQGASLIDHEPQSGDIATVSHIKGESDAKSPTESAAISTSSKLSNIKLDGADLEIIAERKPGPASKTKYYDVLDAKAGLFEPKVRRPTAPESKRNVPLQKTPNIIPRLRPKVNDIVYALNKSLLNFWLQAEILEMIKNKETNQCEFIISYEPTKDGKPTGGIVAEGDGSVRKTRQVCLKELAYKEPPPYLLPTGTRVIAKFRDEFNPDPLNDGYFFAGMIAEPPRTGTRYRYLVFFDDGNAQYVYPDEVLLTCSVAKNPWEDVHPFSYQFIKDYIISYPEWPMVRFSEGAIVRTEWNGMFLPTRVLEVDSSLAKVKFENDGREEWIYRGSARFKPIYRKQKAIVPKQNKIPRHDTTPKSRGGPIIEYALVHKSKDQMAGIAKKSTAGASKTWIEPTNYINTLDPDSCIEYQGKIRKIQVPAEYPKPKEYVPHSCDPSCVIDYISEDKDLKLKSPLMIPFYFGWTREVIKFGNASREITYRAPCGVALKNYEDLNDFLEKTDSTLPIDFFSYDLKVDCNCQFVPTRELSGLKDISYGKETIPVQVSNSLDFDTLPFMEYTPRRVCGQGVNINTQKESLVCCDCTDNCQDKSKCACWKLTLEGISFTKLNDPNIPTQAYENRRLREHITSGIYECNSHCKCKSTCSNRVVQNGVIWPVQIFKTTKKGWGIRSIYDMPEGTFICIYSGQVLTEDCANQDGIEFGDEYLAELDYIECNERVKDGYESDVTDIEDEEGSDGESQHKKAKLDMEKDENGVAKESQNVKGKSKKFATRKTDGNKRSLKNVLNDDDDIITARTELDKNERRRKRISCRELFQPNESCFIMDAKSKGNIGRYLNHSCTPNVFVQNVFVDSHDIRFPLVAFFTNQFVKAGTELTWDYNYSIGSVPGKTMYCYCMSPYCRGRLL